MSFTTPILLITFIRPDQVFNALTAIRQIQPTDLYVAQDGPRIGNVEDEAKIMAVRKMITEMVDWPCSLHTHYSDINLGCGRGPYEAMSWFFSNVDMGIILEEDIVPHPLFFPYCKELLERYKNDKRIGMIAGHNLYRKYSHQNSYYFTYDTEGTLGWATWSRVWKDFRFDIAFDAEDYKKALKKFFYMPATIIRNRQIHFSNVLSGSRHDCWDYQWEYYLQLNNYLNIKPNSCLTSHNGTDPDATHVGYQNPNYLMEVNEPLFQELQHPRRVRIDFREKLRVYHRTLKLFRSHLKLQRSI